MKQLPHEVLIHKNHHYDAESWCRANLGRRWEALGYRDGIWCCFWAGHRASGYYRYYFESEETAMLFALRWT
jgi:hypothetical protein